MVTPSPPMVLPLDGAANVLSGAIKLSIPVDHSRKNSRP
jgi:hypothetical protein